MHICQWSGELKLDGMQFWFTWKLRFFFLDNSYVLKILCVFIRKTVTRQHNVRTWAEFEFLDFFMFAATMTQPFSILPFFPISFSFPNSIYNLLENNIYKFWFVIVVFFGSRRARARRSSDDFSFLIGRKYVVMSADVSLVGVFIHIHQLSNTQSFKTQQ